MLAISKPLLTPKTISLGTGAFVFGMVGSLIGLEYIFSHHMVHTTSPVASTTSSPTATTHEHSDKATGSVDVSGLPSMPPGAQTSSSLTPLTVQPTTQYTKTQPQSNLASGQSAPLIPAATPGIESHATIPPTSGSGTTSNATTTDIPMSVSAVTPSISSDNPLSSAAQTLQPVANPLTAPIR